MQRLAGKLTCGTKLSQCLKRITASTSICNYVVLVIQKSPSSSHNRKISTCYLPKADATSGVSGDLNAVIRASINATPSFFTKIPSVWSVATGHSSIVTIPAPRFAVNHALNVKFRFPEFGYPVGIHRINYVVTNCRRFTKSDVLR